MPEDKEVAVPQQRAETFSFRRQFAFVPGCSNGSHGAFLFATPPRSGWDASRDRSVREQPSPALQARRYLDVMIRPWPLAPVQKMSCYVWGRRPWPKWLKPLRLEIVLHAGPSPLAKVLETFVPEDVATLYLGLRPWPECILGSSVPGDDLTLYSRLLPLARVYPWILCARR